MHEIQSNGRTNTRGGALRKAALVPAAAVAVLVFAVPAHAGDPVQPPVAAPSPTPVAPVDSAASTTPAAVSTAPEAVETEVPEMGVEPGASAPAVELSAPAETPAEAAAPVEPATPRPAVQKPKAPANPATWIRVRTVRPRPVMHRSEWQRVVISPSRPVIHVRAPVARRHVVRPTRHATRASAHGWYQVRPAQYQRAAGSASSSVTKSPPARGKSPPVRADNGATSARQTPSRASIGIRSKPQNGARICARERGVCRSSCSDNVGWKVVWNDRWISGCKSSNAAPETLHEDESSASDTGTHRAGSRSDGKDGAQYQCPATQYHHYWCDDSFGEPPTSPQDEGDPAADEADVDTDTSDEEPTSTCPDTTTPVDAVDGDVGGWDEPSDEYCDDSAADTLIRPGGGTEPPTGGQRPPAQVPQPPVTPVSPETAQAPPTPPVTEQSAAPTSTEQPTPPPPDQPVAEPNAASEPPPAEPAPRPSVPAADAVPENTRAARVGVTRPAHTSTHALEPAEVVVQPSTHAVVEAAPKKVTRVAAMPKPAVRKPHAMQRPQLRKARPVSPATRPATDRTTLQPPRTRPVASTSKPLDDRLLLLALALFGLSVLAFALAAVSEVDGGTAALTKMRSRLGSKGLSASRVDLHAASSRTRDGIRYRD